MKQIVKTRILTTIVFLCIALMSVFVSDYVASYYEKLGRKAPRWGYYCIFAVLGLAYVKFIKAFSSEKDNK
jgi:hypothetical protein